MKDNRIINTQADPSHINLLVDRACGGDKQAFGDLYEIYVGSIYRYVIFHTREHMAADDITSEVFIKAWEAIRTCKGKGNSFRAWLFRIAHNTFVDSTRKKYREYQHTNNVHSDMPMTEPGSRRLEILDMMWRLPPEQREVIMLKFIQDLDNKEIARVIGKKEGAIRMLKLRALSNLKAQFNAMTKE